MHAREIAPSSALLPLPFFSGRLPTPGLFNFFLSLQFFFNVQLDLLQWYLLEMRFPDPHRHRRASVSHRN